jgi:hypothetical protein
MADHQLRGVIRCLHWSDEQQREYGRHHHDGPHACDSGNHDGQCPWWAQMSGPGFERTSDMTAAINGVVEDTAFDIAERR